MKKLLCILAVLLSHALCLAGENPVTVKCGKETVVLFDGTHSPDKQHALGWTIRPVAKGAKPVDWSKLDEKGITLVDDYPHNDWQAHSYDKNAPYVIVDGIVSLSGKSFKNLPFSEPFYTCGNHGWSIHASWLDATRAIVTVNARFSTTDLFLIQIKGSEISAADIYRLSDAQIRKVIETKRPFADDEIEIWYDKHYQLVVNGGLIHLPFLAGYPKGSFEDIEGHLLVSLNNGKPIKAISENEADQPFVGELGEADKHLNEVFGKLRKLLGGESLKQLMSEEKKWITARNEDAREYANEKVPFFEENSTLTAYRKARNQKAIELTLKRTEVLKKQLTGFKSK